MITCLINQVNFIPCYYMVSSAKWTMILCCNSPPEWARYHLMYLHVKCNISNLAKETVESVYCRQLQVSNNNNFSLQVGCSSSPIFPWDHRCQLLSLTGRHLGILMWEKQRRVQNAVGRSGGGYDGRKNRETVTTSLCLMFNGHGGILAPLLIKSINNLLNYAILLFAFWLLTKRAWGKYQPLATDTEVNSCFSIY